MPCVVPETITAVQYTTRAHCRWTKWTVALRTPAIVHAGMPVTLAVTCNGTFRTRDTITLDTRGHLIAETSTLLEPDPDLDIPAGAQAMTATYTIPTIIHTLDITP